MLDIVGFFFLLVLTFAVFVGLYHEPPNLLFGNFGGLGQYSKIFQGTLSFLFKDSSTMAYLFEVYMCRLCQASTAKCFITQKRLTFSLEPAVISSTINFPYNYLHIYIYIIYIYIRKQL